VPSAVIYLGFYRIGGQSPHRTNWVFSLGDATDRIIDGTGRSAAQTLRFNYRN
jgi:hypothetical protein